MAPKKGWTIETIRHAFNDDPVEQMAYGDCSNCGFTMRIPIPTHLIDYKNAYDSLYAYNQGVMKDLVEVSKKYREMQLKLRAILEAK